MTGQTDTSAQGPGPPPGGPARGLPALRALPRVVWLLGLASLLNDVSSEAIFPLLPLFLAQLGAPMRYLGLIEGSADALASVIKMIAGRLSDRGPRRLMVTGGYALPALARAGIAFAAAPFHVLTARLVDRAGKGIRSGPRDAMIADSVAKSERGRAFGLNRAMDHFGAAVGPLIASALIALGVGLRATFFVAAALGLLAPLVLFLRLRDPAHVARPEEPAAQSGSKLRPGYASYLVVCVLFALGNSSDAFLLVRATELGWKNVPLLWFFHHIVKSAVAVPGGALSDRHSRAVVVSAGWAAYALVYVGFGFATQGKHIVVLFLAYALYHGLAEGAERAIIADLAEQGGRGRAFGLYHGFVGVAALPAGLATGLVWDRFGSRAALGMNAAFAALAAILLAWLAFAGPLRRSLVMAETANPVRSLPRRD
ncbi:MAG: major facilitator superfamily 1 [Myxococcales bacterium]|nr:major facilitator superfamily 1 [Myxococcales bacterium]